MYHICTVFSPYLLLDLKSYVTWKYYSRPIKYVIFFSDLNNQQTTAISSFREAYDEIQSRLDGLRTIALLSSIPELVQAPPQERAPRQPLGTPPHNTREEPPTQSPEQPSSLEAPHQGTTIHTVLFHKRSSALDRAPRLQVFYGASRIRLR